MASDSLLDVIAGLVKRDSETKKEEKKLAREKAREEKLKAAAEAEEEEPEEDEDEDPVGDPEAEPEGEDDSEGEGEDDMDNKPSGPDPALVQQVANIVVAQLSDMMKRQSDAEKAKKYDDGEVKLSGKKEKVNTKPKLEQFRKGKMNFQEAVRMAVTGTHLVEGYEQTVLDILENEKIDGPLGYEPFFEKGKLYVEKGSEKKAAKVLKQAREVNKVPKIVGEELQPEEYLAMEAVEVDGRCKGFKEALRRLTYEKIKAIKAKEEVEEVELDEEVFYWYIIKGNFEKGKVAFMGTERQVKLKFRHDPKFSGDYVMAKSRKDLKMGDKWKLSMGVSEEVEIDKTIKIPEGLSKEGAAEFMAAASAAKREGKKKFKFGGKEYPVTIKVDIPLKGK